MLSAEGGFDAFSYAVPCSAATSLHARVNRGVSHLLELAELDEQNALNQRDGKKFEN